MISLLSYTGTAAHALVRGWDVASPATVKAAIRTEQRAALARCVGKPRLRPRTLTRRDLNRMTCKQLDALLRRKKVNGRSKARRKTEKIRLLFKMEIAA